MTTIARTPASGTLRFPGSDFLRRHAGSLIPISAGLFFGLAAIPASEMDLRWIVWILACLAVGATALSVRNKERMLWSVFVLSFQADMSVRFLHGQGGSGGLALSLTGLTGLALVAWHWLNPDARAARRIVFAGRLQAPIVALFVTSVLSLLTAGERFVGLGRLFVEVQFYFAYLLALNLIRNEERLAFTGKLLLGALGIQACIYFLQSGMRETFTLTGEVIAETGTLPRPGGTVSTNPAGFASFIVPILMLATTSFIGKTRTQLTRLAWIPGVLGVIALGLTFTRAAWVGAVIGFTVIAVIAHRRRELDPGKAAALTFAFVMIGIALFPLVAVRLADSVSDSYQERAGLMRMARSIIAQNPLLGIGAGAYEYTYKGYLSPGLTNQWLATVHNEYLLRAAETGIPGGIAWVLLLVLGLRQAFRLTRLPPGIARTFAIAWTAGLAALCWEMYWDSWRGFTYNAFLWFMLGLMESIEMYQAPPRTVPASG